MMMYHTHPFFPGDVPVVLLITTRKTDHGNATVCGCVDATGILLGITHTPVVVVVELIRGHTFFFPICVCADNVHFVAYMFGHAYAIQVTSERGGEGVSTGEQSTNNEQ